MGQREWSTWDFRRTVVKAKLRGQGWRVFFLLGLGIPIRRCGSICWSSDGGGLYLNQRGKETSVGMWSFIVVN